MTNEVLYIKRKNIDTDKYNNCISEAINTQIYAYAWYLDCVADDWDILALGDYEVVMPVPFLKLKRHLFAKKIYQPDYCQQLGVFSKNKITLNSFQLFFDKFITLTPKNYNFNSFDSKCFLENNTRVSDRVNFELNLDNSHELLYANYSKNLKRNIKKAQKEGFHISDKVSVDDFISLKKENTTYKTYSKQYNKKEELLEILIAREFGKIYGVFKAEELVAACLVIHYQNKFINLTSATDDNGKKFGAISFLFDHIINTNASSQYVFDFEGSMIPGVARFFKSFGAEKVIYKSLL